MRTPIPVSRRRRVPRFSPGSRSGRKIIRAGLAGAAATSLIFIGAWTAALVMPGPTGMLVELFTSAAPASTEALKEGILVAFLVGFFGAATMMVVYRAVAVLERL